MTTVEELGESLRERVKEEIYNYFPPTTTTEQSTKIHINTNNNAEQKEAAAKTYIILYKKSISGFQSAVLGCVIVLVISRNFILSIIFFSCIYTF